MNLANDSRIPTIKTVDIPANGDRSKHLRKNISGKKLSHRKNKSMIIMNIIIILVNDKLIQEQILFPCLRVRYKIK